MSRENEGRKTKREKQKTCPKVEPDYSVFVQSLIINYTKKEDKKTKQLESGIEMQMFAVNTEREVWRRLFEYYQKQGKTSAVSSTQLDILNKMSAGFLSLPSEKQSKVLYQLYMKAVAEGFAA